MRGSFYDLLGVSPNADRAEVKARYLLLMRQYHPDVNRDPSAHARAAELNEAFRALMDADLRALHDAELAQRRAEALNARAASIGRSGARRAVALRRRRPLVLRYGAQLALIVLLSGTAAAGWHIQTRLSFTQAFTQDQAEAAPAIDDSDSEARLAVAALGDASIREAQAMPAVSGAAVSLGLDAFRRASAGADPEATRTQSEACHVEAAELGTWDSLDSCVAFDEAGFLAGRKSGGTSPSAIYFQDRHDRAAHLYVSRVVSLEAIDRRLARIRRQVDPARHKPERTPTERVLHSIGKRGRNLMEAIFDLGPADPAPRNF